MNRPRSSTSSLIIVLVGLLGVLISALRWLPSPELRRSKLDASMPKESTGSQASGRPRRIKHVGQSDTVNSLGTSCDATAVPCDSSYFERWQPPDVGTCVAIVKIGFQLPDPRCTPGGIVPSITVIVMRNAKWRTTCIRNCQSTEHQKHIAYNWYGLSNPQSNAGKDQTCELDHLVPLELGGADGMGNIWPQCGATRALLSHRDFKIKDRVENYLADEVKAGRMSLSVAQRGIAEDWTQYLGAANRYCEEGGRCGRRHE